MEITEERLNLAVYDPDNGCNAGSATLKYTFDGRAFKTEFFGFPLNLTIKSYTDNEFTWDYYGETETYIRQ